MNLAGCSGPCIPAMHITRDQTGAIAAVRSGPSLPLIIVGCDTVVGRHPVLCHWSCFILVQMILYSSSRPPGHHHAPPHHITDELVIVYYSVLASFQFPHFRTLAFNITNILLNIVVYIIPGSSMRVLLQFNLLRCYCSLCRLVLSVAS